MKRVFALLFALVAALSLPSCGEDEAVIQLTYKNQLMLNYIKVEQGSSGWYATYVEPETTFDSQVVYWQTEFPAVEKNATTTTTGKLLVSIDDASIVSLDDSELTSFSVATENLYNFTFTVEYTPQSGGIDDEPLYIIVTDEDKTGLYRKIPLYLSQAAYSVN